MTETAATTAEGADTMTATIEILTATEVAALLATMTTVDADEMTIVGAMTIGRVGETERTPLVIVDVIRTTDPGATIESSAAASTACGPQTPATR